jgi:ATP-dependent DNA ligase
MRQASRPLQNYGSANTPLFYYVFDVMMLQGKDVMSETLGTRRRLLEERVLLKPKDPIRYSSELDAASFRLISIP